AMGEPAVEHLYELNHPATPGREVVFARPLPYPVKFSDAVSGSVEAFVVLSSVCGTIRPLRAATGAGCWVQTAEGRPSTNPAGALVGSKALELWYGLHRQSDGTGADGELVVGTAGRRAHERHTNLPSAREVLG